jgi:peptidoglycan/xylan/chitin deacetylase (PgdA/CDA1 family)
VCGPEGHAYASPAICVSPAAFEAHSRYLAAHYRVLPLPEVVARVRDGRPLPANTVVVTFDDGYADNLDAARILASHGLTATFYLTSGCLAGGEPFWPAEVRELVTRLPGQTLRLDAPAGPAEAPLGGADDREAAIRLVTRLFKSCSIPEREQMREELRRQAGGGGAAACMLTWGQVAEMHRLGMTIGAHTVTHANLPSAGLEAATAEIAGSKVRLERELGSPVTMFSYPNGGAQRYYTPELQQVVREAGFDAAATSQNGFATRASDLFALERVEVRETLEDLVFALEVERFAFAPRRP